MKPEFKIQASSFTGKERLVSSLLEEGYILNVEEGEKDSYTINVFGKKEEEQAGGKVVYSRPAEYLKRPRVPVTEKKINPSKDEKLKKMLQESEDKRIAQKKVREPEAPFPYQGPYIYEEKPYWENPVKPIPYSPNVPYFNGHTVWCEGNKPL